MRPVLSFVFFRLTFCAEVFALFLSESEELAEALEYFGAVSENTMAGTLGHQLIYKYFHFGCKTLYNHLLC